MDNCLFYCLPCMLVVLSCVPGKRGVEAGALALSEEAGARIERRTGGEAEAGKLNQAGKENQAAAESTVAPTARNVLGGTEHARAPCM